MAAPTGRGQCHRVPGPTSASAAAALTRTPCGRPRPCRRRRAGKPDGEVVSTAAVPRAARQPRSPQPGGQQKTPSPGAAPGRRRCRTRTAVTPCRPPGGRRPGRRPRRTTAAPESRRRAGGRPRLATGVSGSASDGEVRRSLSQDELQVVRGPRDRIRGGYHGFAALSAEQDDRGTGHADRCHNGIDEHRLPLRPADPAQPGAQALGVPVLQRGRGEVTCPDLALQGGRAQAGPAHRPRRQRRLFLKADRRGLRGRGAPPGFGRAPPKPGDLRADLIRSWHIPQPTPARGTPRFSAADGRHPSPDAQADPLARERTRLSCRPGTAPSSPRPTAPRASSHPQGAEEAGWGMLVVIEQDGPAPGGRRLLSHREDAVDSSPTSGPPENRTAPPEPR
jgi:hypothetical protein